MYLYFNDLRLVGVMPDILDIEPRRKTTQTLRSLKSIVYFRSIFKSRVMNYFEINIQNNCFYFVFILFIPSEFYYDLFVKCKLSLLFFYSYFFTLSYEPYDNDHKVGTRKKNSRHKWVFSSCSERLKYIENNYVYFIHWIKIHNHF